MTQVLIADDDADLRETVRTLLESDGYAVSEATNGREALAALRSSSTPLVALLDMVMPGLSGLQVLEAVAADPVLSARHAYLLLTANHRPLLDGTADLLAQLGVIVVHKPFDIDFLLAEVARASARLP